MKSGTSAGRLRKRQLAQFIFEGRECHGCDLEAMDVRVSALLMRLSFILLRCKDHIAHAGVELRICIEVQDGVAGISEIGNWSELPAGLQQRLRIELELPPAAVATPASRAA